MAPLRANGRFTRGGRAIHPVGFNYMPSATGCQFWTRWDPSALERDFAEIAARGFTVVRIFTFWRDFEPVEGEFDRLVFGRLREAAAIADRRGLLVIPSIFSLLHLLHVFDLEWRRGRNLFADPVMMERARAYAGAVAETLRDTPNVLAYDVHDEQYNVDGAAATTPLELERWQTGVTGAIRAAHPGVPVMQSLDHQAITSGLAFRPDRSDAYDLLGAHAYPQWTPFAIESTNCYKATIAPSFLVAFSRTFRPTMVDELGLIGASDERVSGHVRAAAASTLANGAIGTLAWCWQDAATPDDPPYVERPWVGRFGLTRADGAAKPALAEYEAFASLARELADATLPAAAVGLYVPEDFNPTALGTRSRDGVCLFYAFALAKRAHLPVAFAREPLARHRLLIAPSMRLLTRTDQRRLREFVEGGGSLLYSSRETLDAFDAELLGVELDDFTLDPSKQASFELDGQTYPVDWTTGAGAGATIPIVKARTATVLASYADGPALTRAPVGAGEVFFLNAPFEAQLDAAGRLTAHPWHVLYESIAARAGVAAPLTCSDPDVEIAVLQRGCGGTCAIAINHAAGERAAVLRNSAGIVATLSLVPKGVEIVALDDAGRETR